MWKLIATLSLVLITGTKAENSGNLIGDDLECAFLNCQYDYPSIHMHKQFNESDPYIYSGSTDPYLNTAITTHNINLDTQKFEIEQVNYGYKYKAYANGVVEIAVGFFKEDGELTYGNFIDDQIHTYQVTADGNTWTNIDHTYTNTSVLKDADVIAMGIRGVSDRSTTSCPFCGSDDILFSDLYLNYDYKEIPLDLITDPVYDIAKVDIKYDLDANGVPKIDEIKVEVKVDEVKVDTPAPTVAQPVQQPVAKTTTTTVQKKTEKKKQTAKKKTKENKKNESKQTTNTRNQRDIENFTTASMVSSMVDSGTGGSVNGFFSNNGMDLLSSGGIDLVDTIQLIEPTFYDEPDFYESEILLTDTLKFNNIDFYKETSWYGSNTKFY